MKFTRAASRREITVVVEAYTGTPLEELSGGIEWFPSRSESQGKDLTLGEEWGDGEPLSLLFAIQDTGRGLTIEEKARLFRKFSQASPRTHIEYGGSGLGLFISRELTELHGGQIGVASEAGVGSEAPSLFLA